MALLPVVVGILTLGVGAQLLAKRMQVPSVLFLIAIGVVVGPEGLGFVTLDTFGEGLSTIVGVSVAIIIFDGAFHLRREKLEQAPKAVRRLTTVGAALAFVGTGVAVRVFLGTEWDVAFLIGALLIATGPTVITPLLEVVTVRDHLRPRSRPRGSSTTSPPLCSRSSSSRRSSSGILRRPFRSSSSSVWRSGSVSGSSSRPSSGICWSKSGLRRATPRRWHGW